MTRLERPLKQIVDAGYARNDDDAQAAKPAADAAKADESKADDAKADESKPKPRHRADRERPAFKTAHDGKPRHRATSPRQAEPSNSAPEGDDESASAAA